MCIDSLESRNNLTYRDTKKKNHCKNKERGRKGQTGERPVGMTTAMAHFAVFAMVFVLRKP